MKYTLVNPKIINDTTYWQVRALLPFKNNIKLGQLGGWVNNKQCLSQDGECWIEDGAIVTDSRILDDIIIQSDCQITDSIISGRGFVEPGCIINNCKIQTFPKSWGIIDKNTIIQDKTINFVKVLDNRITNTNYWQVYERNGLIIYCGEHHCKAGCITASYIEMWKTLNQQNNILAENKDNLWFTPQKVSQNLDWLKQKCLAELYRLNT